MKVLYTVRWSRPSSHFYRYRPLVPLPVLWEKDTLSVGVEVSASGTPGFSVSRCGLRLVEDSQLSRLCLSVVDRNSTLGGGSFSCNHGYRPNRVIIVSILRPTSDREIWSMVQNDIEIVGRLPDHVSSPSFLT